jgi:hypothetical protein
MSRESNDAFDAFAKRKGYKPGTWNYIRTAEAWQTAIAFATPVGQPATSSEATPAPVVPADPTAPAIPVSLLRQHWLRVMECDHEGKQDKPHCACSRVDLGWHPTVSAALEAWLAHVQGATTEAALAATSSEAAPAPVVPTDETALRAGVRQLTLALREREWADLLTTDSDLAALEEEVRKLLGERHEGPVGHPAAQAVEVRKEDDRGL